MSQTEQARPLMIQQPKTMRETVKTDDFFLATVVIHGRKKEKKVLKDIPENVMSACRPTLQSETVPPVWSGTWDFSNIQYTLYTGKVLGFARDGTVVVVKVHVIDRIMHYQ